MAVRKVTVSLTEEAFDRALRAAKGANMSLSAWLSQAAIDQIRVADGLAAVVGFESIHGAPTAEELEQTRRELEAAGLYAPFDADDEATYDAALSALREGQTSDGRQVA